MEEIHREYHEASMVFPLLPGEEFEQLKTDIFYGGDMDNLTTIEHQELTRHEAIIERGLQTFTEVGDALLAIRDGRLYRQAYSTFEEYCRQKWDISRSRAHRLIVSAGIARNLLPIGNISPPTNEAQARPLTGLEPGQQREVWMRAVETAPVDKEGKPRITAAHVQKVVDGVTHGDQLVEDEDDLDDLGEGCWNCKHALSVYRGEGDFFCCAYSMIVYAQGCSWCEHWENEIEKHHTMDVMSSSKSPEWYTPPHIIELTLRLFSGTIDTDPCSNSKDSPNVPATFLYTKENNGLSQTWHGSVYMNPPYGKEIPIWTEALVEKYEKGEIKEAIALLPGRIDTKWFQPMYDYLICNIRGRLNYPQSESATPFPSVIVYFGDNKDGFIQIFSELGPILKRVG